MLAAETSPDQWALIAFIPLAAAFGAWLVKQIMEHARVMAKLSAELSAHTAADDTVHVVIEKMGSEVTDIRLEQTRVSTQLAASNIALSQIGLAATHAAEAAAAAVALAAASAAKVVQQTAADTAAVLAAPHV